MITIITGGVKSGKSSFALELGKNYQKKLYIATSEAFDEEMKKKIQRHRTERDHTWSTVEEPLNIDKALTQNSGFEYVVLDCITVWLNNILYHKNDVEQYFNSFADTLKIINLNITIVTNETGMGIIPADSLTREYVNLLGTINQKIAKIADNLILMVSGYPFWIKRGGCVL
jgi:adenosylcobinamide kinase/adenosylcobinamide-phosphate guanylyltransferase